MVELNIEVDNNDNVIGLRQHDDYFTGKYIHRSSHLILFNSNHEILIQKRDSTKKWYPDLYTYSVSGTVRDESYTVCIEREMQEEIGISTKVKYLFTYPFFDTLDKAFHAVFVGKSDENIKPDTSEISKIEWIPPAQLKKEIIVNPSKFTPPFVAGMTKYFTEFYKTESNIT